MSLVFRSGRCAAVTTADLVPPKHCLTAGFTQTWFTLVYTRFAPARSATVVVLPEPRLASKGRLAAVAFALRLDLPGIMRVQTSDYTSADCGP